MGNPRYSHYEHGCWNDIVRLAVPASCLRTGGNRIGLRRCAPTPGFAGAVEVRKFLLDLSYPSGFAPGRVETESPVSGDGQPDREPAFGGGAADAAGVQLAGRGHGVPLGGRRDESGPLRPHRGADQAGQGRAWDPPPPVAFHSALPLPALQPTPQKKREESRRPCRSVSSPHEHSSHATARWTPAKEAKLMRRNGFTLIELLVVIAII